eukprot:CAMPEP_0177621324 /NCGR_PEP_ID=MMETSP0419_2-20121207/27520_1 /TAXON_ID=582737 /ORGANISM="Tetraselmis sp., Strain GSL018" /LENGTH=76 /DNA_ID=CAMNT_0019121225 /DNA_START=268 /DNA_END=496 /DNA_ORIENTATION=-
MVKHLLSAAAVTHIGANWSEHVENLANHLLAHEVAACDLQGFGQEQVGFDEEPFCQETIPEANRASACSWKPTIPP